MKVANFYELLNNGFSMDQVYLLSQMKEGTSEFPDIQRVNEILQFLVRKGLCTEKYTITAYGEEFLIMVLSEKIVNISPMKRAPTSFYAQWLRTFPSTDGFSWKGKSFSKTRVLRKNTEKCRELFTKIMAEGEYTVDDMCMSIIAEALAKMELSYKAGENKMAYFINSESYLRQRIFEGFMEDGRKLTQEQIEEYGQAMGSKREQQNTTLI